MKNIFSFLFVSLFISSVFIGCKKDEPGTEPSPTLTDEEQIRNALDNWEKAFESKNLSSIMVNISDSYLNDSDVKIDVQNIYQNSFSQRSYTLTFSNMTIAITQDRATASGHFKAESQVDTYEADFGPRNTWFWGTFWRKESSVWRMFGNQQKYRFGVSSWHVSNGYYAEINVSDPNKQIVSARATGPGIIDTMNLEYRSGDGLSTPKWWHTYNPFLGISVPVTPQTFVISITDGSGTSSYSKTITGFVQLFATNLLPSGNVSGTVTFSWTGIANAGNYSIELNENNSDRIWNATVAGTTTSKIYDGPALTLGQTYQYSVIASIATDGVGNASCANNQFMYVSGP